ncbi:hypothetical protein EUTSA_v10003072mg [Eutrema salsugineum]|uniref:SWIM-type domain-containing protein n=1 Tax=Eutrema salsugineum TaxID=72664 RepID=V4KZS4_EUTSA|nr:hypothetical protein EUTSA_v10003072mg [Eutrema salsugineum]
MSELKDELEEHEERIRYISNYEYNLPVDFLAMWTNIETAIEDIDKIKLELRTIQSEIQTLHDELANSLTIVAHVCSFMTFLRLSLSCIICSSPILPKGNPNDESYSQIPLFISYLKAANPTTITELETHTDENGSQHFKRLFISHGASQEGFHFLRKLMVVSGAHIRRSDSGFLIVAIGQYANFQTYPLAFAVVDHQTEEAWRWFLHQLEQCFPDNNKTTILSDGGGMAERAISACFPEASHVDCLRRLQLSLNLYFHDNGITNLVREAACAHTIGVFRRAFNRVNETNPDCATYLQSIGFPRWTSYYQAGDRYNIMTASIAHGFIHLLLPQTTGPIINLLNFYHTTVMRWLQTRLRASMDHPGVMSPGVQGFMDKLAVSKSQWQVLHISYGACEVVNSVGKIHFVNPLRRSCSCKVFNKLWIPCIHALVASDALRISAESLVHTCYTSVAWFETYIPQLYPCQEPLPAEATADGATELLPPISSPLVGRPRPKTRMVTINF